ncbi:MAG: dihydrodipicolinate synthase family protein [Verrucomicrobiota bacterium JB022]|nr:dihydrodipicolinate synthase family protein [Verrucomicrobiota bacterium JB022]
MKPNFPSEGILVALALPTDAQGALCADAIRQHLQWLRGVGIHGALALGSTGEFSFFSLEERKRILAFTAEAAAPLPVIANVSDINPKVACELAKTARDEGLAGVAVMPPSFYPVSAADQLAFFLKVAEAAAPLPVMLYNFPELACNRIAIETVEAFADRANMKGYKQSGREFSYHSELIAMGKEKGFGVFSGADTRLPEVFQLGAAGCIGGLVNMVPELMLEQFRVYKQGQPGELEPTASRMKEVGQIIDRLTFPINVPAGLAARGFEPGVPKSIVSAQSQEIFDGIVKDLRAKFVEWGLPLYQAK